jgi:hypothetical protein
MRDSVETSVKVGLLVVALAAILNGYAVLGILSDVAQKYIQ